MANAHLASDINLNGSTTCPLPDQALTSDEYLFLSTAYCIFLFLYVLFLNSFGGGGPSSKTNQLV